MSKKKKGSKKKTDLGDGVDPVEQFRGEWKKMKKTCELKKQQTKQKEELVDEENLDDGELKEVSLYNFLIINHF